MKIYFLSFVFLLLVLAGKSQDNEYTPLPLHQMILEAELIVSGEIISTASDDFDLKVHDKIFGSLTDSVLSVKQYVNWKCSSRWATYLKGQNLLLFLKKNEKNEWEILSRGGEGEMPVSEGLVSVPACYCIAMPFCRIEERGLNGEIRTAKFDVYELYGSEYRGMKFKLEQFTEALLGLKDSFGLKDKRIVSLIAPGKISAYKDKSALCAWLAESCEKE